MKGSFGFRISSSYYAWVAGVAAVAAAAFLLFGFTGFRSVIAIALLFVIPPLLLLRKTGLDIEEKIFFSFFIGLGLFPLLVFALNQLLPSFRLSIIAAFAAVAIASRFLASRFLINLFR
ncbi:hypothetical protein HYV85_06490 [Candidatus Woesearchaeota archaeon]|nr:hypothetical protein [Candidatus Woesearchaeota archaeon]